jgi:hypothetical protein
VRARFPSITESAADSKTFHCFQVPFFFPCDAQQRSSSFKPTLYSSSFKPSFYFP